MKFLSFVAIVAFSLYAFAAAEVDNTILAAALKRDDNTCVCLDGLTCIIKLGEPTCLNATLASSSVQTDGTSDDSCTCPDGATCVIKNGQQTCLKTVSRSDNPTLNAVEDRALTCADCPAGCQHTEAGKVLCIPGATDDASTNSSTLNAIEDRGLNCGGCPGACQHTESGELLCIPLGVTVTARSSEVCICTNGAPYSIIDGKPRCLKTLPESTIEDRGLNCGDCPGGCQHTESGELLCIPLGANVAVRSDDVCICTNGAPCTIIDGKPRCLKTLPRNTVVCDCTVGRTCREQKQGGYLCVRNKLKRDNNVCDCPAGTTCRAKKEGGYLCISD